MAENSKIEWTDHTFNPWEGCQKVGPGCDHCYAENRNARFGGGVAVNWGPGAPRRRTSESNWRKPLTWDAAHAEFFAAHGRRQRVFCASLADVFDNEIPRVWRDDLATLILNTPNLDWLLLSKRIGNAGRMLGEMFLDGPPDNIWLGATVVNQAEANRDIPKLLAVPARVRFLSIEPMLGPINLTHVMRSSLDSDWTYCDNVLTGFRANKCGGHTDPRNAVQWVICGGESGPGARPAHPDWFRTLRDTCAAASVPFLFKQWGEWSQWRHELVHEGPNSGATRAGYMPARHYFRDDDKTMKGLPVLRVGKKAAGRLLDGVEHNGFPEVPHG